MHNIFILGLAAFLLTLPFSPADENIPAAIYQGHPYHLWNRIHHAFFARPDVESVNVDAVDPPLWKNTENFLQSGASHRRAIAVLDEFLEHQGEALFEDPVKRAMLQHDLWAVFDWTARPIPAAQARDAGKNLAALRSRLADAIRRLALNDREIAALPDNLAQAAAAKRYRADWDPKHPQAPFLPADLLDPDGSWVCVRGAFASPSGPYHAAYYNERSPFLVFIRLPAGHSATMGYLDRVNTAVQKSIGGDAKDLPLFPVGTAVALLRRMTVIDTAGQVRITPLVQTLQMRVYRQVGCDVTDHKNSQAAVKFRVERKALFAGRHGGLAAVGADEPAVVSLINFGDIYDRDHGAGKTVMQSCIACHSCGGATVHSIFTFKQDDWIPGAQNMAPNRLRLIRTTPEQEIARSIASKTKRYDWGLLQGLLDAGSKR